MEENVKKYINKKNVIIVITTVLAVILVLGLIFSIIKINGKETNKKLNIPQKGESDFENIEIVNIKLDYDENDNITNVNFILKNKTEIETAEKVADIILLNDQEQQIAGIETVIEKIEGNGEYPMTVKLAGKVEGITKLKLQKVSY